MKDQQEQQHQHRHHNRQENSRHQNNRKPGVSKRVGQVFGLIYNIALVYFVCDLAKSGNQKLALGLFAINAALIVFAAIIVRKSSKNRGDNRRRNFRPRSREQRGDRERNRG